MNERYDKSLVELANSIANNDEMLSYTLLESWTCTSNELNGEYPHISYKITNENARKISDICDKILKLNTNTIQIMFINDNENSYMHISSRPESKGLLFNTVLDAIRDYDENNFKQNNYAVCGICLTNDAIRLNLTARLSITSNIMFVSIGDETTNYNYNPNIHLSNYIVEFERSGNIIYNTYRCDNISLIRLTNVMQRVELDKNKKLYLRNKS